MKINANFNQKFHYSVLKKSTRSVQIFSPSIANRISQSGGVVTILSFIHRIVFRSSLAYRRNKRFVKIFPSLGMVESAESLMPPTQLAHGIVVTIASITRYNTLKNPQLLKYSINITTRRLYHYRKRSIKKNKSYILICAV